MRKLDAEVGAVNLQRGGAAAADGARPAVLRRRRQVRELPQVGDGVLEEDRARAARGRRWSTAASRTTTSASAATSPATARSAAPASGTPTSCATCSARSATARDRTRRRGGTGGAARGPQGDARQHLHRRATTSSTPTRSSTRPTCATSSGRATAPSARKKLGDGPTGHELRTAALARAKQAGKAQVEARSAKVADGRLGQRGSPTGSSGSTLADAR